MWDWFVPVGLMVAAVEAIAFVLIMAWAFTAPANPPPHRPVTARPSAAPARIDYGGHGLRCWWCDVEPTYLLWAFGDAHPIPRWPDGDHDHSVTPPTPAELIDRGYRTMRRITEIWSE